MGSFVTKITDAVGLTDSKAGDRAAKGSLAGAELTAQGQRDALEYLKEVDAVPRGFREEALSRQAGIAGLEGGTGSQQDMIDQAMNSPLYTAMLEGGQDQANANASAMGMTRSGNLMAESSANQNRALVTAYDAQMQPLSGLAGLPSMAPQIANTTAGIGQTLGQGQIAASQAQLTGSANNTSNMMGLAKMGMMAFSDIRLKKNIEFNRIEGGHKLYNWDWNDAAAELGLFGSSTGVMAHQVHEYLPEAIGECDGYITVDYAHLNLQEAA